MTEDDTFKKLMKPTFREMSEFVMNFNIEHNGGDKILLRRLMNEKGWPLEEYISAYDEYYNLEDIL